MKTVKSNRKLERIRRLEAMLDDGFGSCILGEDQCAKVVQDALVFLDGKRFDLLAWVIMNRAL